MPRGRRKAPARKAATPPPQEEEEAPQEEPAAEPEPQQNDTNNAADESMQNDGMEEDDDDEPESPPTNRRGRRTPAARTTTNNNTNQNNSDEDEPTPTSEEDSVLKVLLSTDNHLGYNERDPIRGMDSFAALEEVLSLARQNKVDLVLLSGDLFHDNKPSRKTLHTVRLCVFIVRSWFICVFSGVLGVGWVCGGVDEYFVHKM